MNINIISTDTFNMYDYNTTDGDFMNNRLYATFTQQNSLDELIIHLSTTYTIMYMSSINKRLYGKSKLNIKIFLIFIKQCYFHLSR